MIRISQVKIKMDRLKNKNKSGAMNQEEIQEVSKEVQRFLRVNDSDISSIKVIKKSIDARRGRDISYTFTVDVDLEKGLQDTERIKRLIDKNANKVKIITDHQVVFDPIVLGPKGDSTVVVGAGPAGLMCCYLLALNGKNPVLIEQGAPIEERINDVQRFWEKGELCSYSNVCFGEGGAGTFSDGKLNTSVKDSLGRMAYVKRLFVACGAPEEILYLDKPHIGTDQLRNVIMTMRNEIIRLGGSVHFYSKMENILLNNNLITGILCKCTKTGITREIPCQSLVLATGHSARDTYEMLQDKVMMEPKDFAIGIRVQHSQDLIGKAQYKEYYKKLPPADYRLRYHTSNDRAVYSFCMCPGGYVVNASTEKNHLVVNGMSNHARDSKVANSAIVVNVTKKDFESEDVLAGVEFQRKWEAIAYQIGNGKIPIQKLADYKNNQKTVEFNVEYNETKGEFCLANIREALPEYVNEAILEAMEDFDRKISGFGNDSVVLCGVETRTSAPVRIVRDENLVSSISNVYPCGEGAGYAGGIMSAAVDGCKVAMAILGK